ncbi:hypothetical protein K0M31_001673 [Melipona bicolor]|uniref:Uncharacterized protein n=1 Tax=Melipona bicolor TaxID=60889 RepID=A0AA40KY21_9HYME|nr:hypothetical protein K0M31_001673 [Melipona bicolor]
MHPASTELRSDERRRSRATRQIRARASFDGGVSRIAGGFELVCMEGSSDARVFQDGNKFQSNLSEIGKSEQKSSDPDRKRNYNWTPDSGKLCCYT